MQEWEVSQYQSAAIELCHRLNLGPFELVDSMNMSSQPQWFKYAAQMAEYELMVQVMRQYGRLV